MLAALPSLFVISPFFSNHAPLHFFTAMRFSSYGPLRVFFRTPSSIAPDLTQMTR
jgi:hypothetical protein